MIAYLVLFKKIKWGYNYGDPLGTFRCEVFQYKRQGFPKGSACPHSSVESKVSHFSKIQLPSIRLLLCMVHCALGDTSTEGLGFECSRRMSKIKNPPVFSISC